MASSFPLQGGPGRYEPRVQWVVTFRGHPMTVPCPKPTRPTGHGVSYLDGVRVVELVIAP
jgi:hypothetical protein